MKHENHFFLYAIASAFLMTSGMMLISSASQQRYVESQAQVSSANISLQQEKKVETYTISGHVEGLSDDTRQVMEISLWKENSDGFMRNIESKRLDGVQGFSYNFSKLKPGTYAIKLDTSDGVDVIEPKSSLQGFSEPTHIIITATQKGILEYSNRNFTVLESL